MSTEKLPKDIEPQGKNLSDYHCPQAKRPLFVKFIRPDGSPLSVTLDLDNLPPGMTVTEE